MPALWRRAVGSVWLCFRVPGAEEVPGLQRDRAEDGDRLMGSRNWDKSPETSKDTKFHDLRASGYRGPIDQDGDKARLVGKGRDARIVKEK
jgi:hypothetical protein